MGDSELLNYLFFIIFSKHISEPAHLVFIAVRKTHLWSVWHQERLVANLFRAGFTRWNFPGLFTMVHRET